MKERDLLQSGYRYALSLTQNTHEAEDLVQDVWLKLYINRSEVKSKSLFYTAIRNLFIDRYRRNKLIIVEELIDIEDETVPFNDLSDKDIERCLEKLRPEEREVLFLNCVEEYSAREIAELTGQPRSTVLSLLNRGKKKFISTYNYLFSSGLKSSSS
ncbi:MAG: sigma-70 family RNA polymerase sigma factor [Candidatus Dadabacteria bacterium]|nr:sigma-70 family RNA polymerase sigma factor [Candidatus Dadabacteria bacterium]NIQ15852.1 sigma-70 family RNA polymerase sigma factor [Candidatus Dadabacteria bacterium]